MPPASPAAIMLVNSASKAFGNLRIASASDAPPSTSIRVFRMISPKFLSPSCFPQDVETLHERQTGVDHHGKLASEDREVLCAHPWLGGGAHQILE